MDPDQLLSFLEDPSWDAPFFKRLAHNDTGNAAGHQGGVLIPRVLGEFFPALDESLASPSRPTVDYIITAELFLAGIYVGQAPIRYQFQTWGGERSPERRLTRNLGPLLNEAHAGDILIMQRCRDRLDLFRILLVRRTDEAFARFSNLAHGRHGALFQVRRPISRQEFIAARDAMLVDTELPFTPFRPVVPRNTRLAIARDAAFRDILLTEYNRRCAISGIALATESLAEVQAAHIIPLGRGGIDEPRNGGSSTNQMGRG